MWASLAVSMRTARLPSYSREIAHTPLMSVIAAVRPVYSLARALRIRITCVLTWYIDVDTPHICTRARRRPGTQPARASAAPTNPRREPIAVSTHAGTSAGKVPSKCTYIDRRTRGARRRRTSSGPQRCAAATTRTCVTACDAEYLVCTYIDGSARPPSPSPGGLTPLRSMQNKAV